MDRLLEFFLIHPTAEVHLRELSRRLKISFPWVRKLVKILASQGLLLSRRERGLVIVQADRERQNYKAAKRSYNLLSLYKSGLVQMLVDAYGHPDAIIVFGSYAHGDDTETSDVDIAIITRRKAVSDLAPFEKRLHRTIRIQELGKGNISHDFLTTLANGIVVAGYLEL